MTALPSIRDAHIDLAGRQIGVLGAARSGVGCARLLTVAGARVTVGDAKPPEDLDAAHLQAMREAGAEVRAPVAALDELGDLDMLVVSPGVPLEALVVREARAAGIAVTGEIEVAFRFCRAPVIAVAGTNAKGSTCTLTGAMLNLGGVDTRVCGNIGDPFSGAVSEGHVPQVYVVEVSSFQLETIETFRPWVAVLLNLTPDHLDRHVTFDAYVAVKARLFENQTSNDWAVVNADDESVRRAAARGMARRLTFSATGGDASAHLEGGTLVCDVGSGPVPICRTDDLVRQGRPYVETVLASSAAALIAGADLDGVREAVRTHALPEHVLEAVCTVGGITFIDSSKATNPAAAEADIESFDGPLVVIAGGLDKGADFAGFGALLDRRARAAYVIGECAQRIAEATKSIPVGRCASLEEATRRAYEAARPGDKVVLAPACASWDMFPSYKVRGARFRQIAQQIAGEARDAG